jgi:lipopolysaccharide biosynthesis glycosyltransferase
LPEVEKNNKSFGDQKLIAAHYPDWVDDSKLHLDHKFNMFIGTIQYHVDKYNYNLNFKRPDNKTIAVIHFIGSIKPWMKSSKEQLATIRMHEKKGNLVDAKMIAHYYNLIN